MMTAAWSYPFWFAHRGAGKLAPENTLAAMRVGASHGFRAFECDVRLSADRVPFLLHDATLDRTTSGQGIAGERVWSELSRLDAGAWHGRGFAGEPPATLESVARYVRRNGFALDIEIKPTPGTEALTGETVADHAARLWHGDPLPPLLTSFQAEALSAARQAAPALPRGLLLEQFWPDWFQAAHDLGCSAVITHYAIADAALIAQLRGAGLKALVYTVNDPAEVLRLITLGIDGIVTDAVDHFSPAAAMLLG
ncbi:MAG TPA: glycerophosphodiester phosphodiesterase [Burkholderiaceae bacterium]|nr:glycerophosphodiester phosphodiesterase [Burkholderiaceae bacterium]